MEINNIKSSHAIYMPSHYAKTIILWSVLEIQLSWAWNTQEFWHDVEVFKTDANPG